MPEDDLRWARALALGAAITCLGGAVLDVAPDLRERVAIASLACIILLVLGWRRLAP